MCEEKNNLFRKPYCGVRDFLTRKCGSRIEDLFTIWWEIRGEVYVERQRNHGFKGGFAMRRNGDIKDDIAWWTGKRRKE